MYPFTDRFMSNAENVEFLKATMMGPNAMRVSEELSSHLKIDENMRVLDLGCGSGSLLQILAEELCRDKKGKKYWKRIRKANHLLDAECLAAACADSSWLPSLKMLAEWMKQDIHAATPVKRPEMAVARSRWMERGR